MTSLWRHFTDLGVENKRLQAHIRGLEALLWIDEAIPDWIVLFDPRGKPLNPRRVTIVVNLLLKRKFASHNTIRKAVGCTSGCVPVYMNGARKFLRQHGIEIRNSWGSGWSIAAADKAKLREAIGRDERAA